MTDPDPTPLEVLKTLASPEPKERMTVKELLKKLKDIQKANNAVH